MKMLRTIAFLTLPLALTACGSHQTIVSAPDSSYAGEQTESNGASLDRALMYQAIQREENPKLKRWLEENYRQQYEGK